MPVGDAIDAGCEDALRELERHGYPIWRVRGYAAIDTARNQIDDYIFHITGAVPVAPSLPSPPRN